MEPRFPGQLAGSTARTALAVAAVARCPRFLTAGALHLWLLPLWLVFAPDEGLAPVGPGFRATPEDTAQIRALLFLLLIHRRHVLPC